MKTIQRRSLLLLLTLPMVTTCAEQARDPVAELIAQEYSDRVELWYRTPDTLKPHDNFFAETLDWAQEPLQLTSTLTRRPSFADLTHATSKALNEQELQMEYSSMQEGVYLCALLDGDENIAKAKREAVAQAIRKVKTTSGSLTSTLKASILKYLDPATPVDDGVGLGHSSRDGARDEDEDTHNSTEVEGRLRAPLEEKRNDPAARASRGMNRLVDWTSAHPGEAGLGLALLVVTGYAIYKGICYYRSEPEAVDA
jgi:hypothetical protein